tara:strand:+ start:2437 stop:2874 length:438 start_codon:yes stop_codon:yes gene_type:complete
MRINWANLPPDPAGMSMKDLSKAYRQLWNALEEQKRQKRAIQNVNKANRKELLQKRDEAKTAKGRLVTLSRKQKAKEEASKANYWSGGAAICVALFYELCKASEGWIGGPKYQSFWQHEAMISTLTFLTTSLFAWVYRAAHPDSK